MKVKETYWPSAVIISPFERSMKLTAVVELSAGVRTSEPDCCMITAPEPSMVVVSLKVETGSPELGPVLGEALGAAEGAILPGAVGAML